MLMRSSGRGGGGFNGGGVKGLSSDIGLGSNKVQRSDPFYNLKAVLGKSLFSKSRHREQIYRTERRDWFVVNPKGRGFKSLGLFDR